MKKIVLAAAALMAVSWNAVTLAHLPTKAVQHSEGETLKKIQKADALATTPEKLTASAAETTPSRVYVNMNELINKSVKGQELAQFSQQKNKELQELLSVKQSELKALEQQTLMSQFSEETAPIKKAELEAKQRQAQLELETKKIAMEAEFSGKLRAIENSVRKVIANVARENNWAEVIPAEESRALFFSPELDKTETILNAFNKAEQTALAQSMLRSEAKAPEFLSA